MEDLQSGPEKALAGEARLLPIEELPRLEEGLLRLPLFVAEPQEASREALQSLRREHAVIEPRDARISSACIS